MRRGGLVGRAVLTLAAAVVPVAVAPVAVASPESDADAAITAAWEAGGGADSRLGPKQGQVYAVGDGFVQDFAGGKIFFTPATGARSLYGPILDLYESLGGPAGSDLGFPTISEVPGLAGPDTLVSTFSASDKPVIFWSAAHGAFVVRGAMNAAWDKLGSSGGPLGVPVSDETYDGENATQSFSGGRVSWNRMTKVFTTVPPELAQQLTGLQVPIDATAAINTAWRAAGGATGPLGAKQGGQYPVGDNGVAQNFVGGKVFFSPATGANAVEGDLLAKYESLGGPVGSDLGFPTANETDGGIKPASRISTFSAADKPVIFWTPAHGAFVVRGAMKAAWDKLGGAKGKLGAPVGDQTVNGDVVSQKFTGGTISWNRATNTYAAEPPSLASSLSGLQAPGQTQPSRPVMPAGGKTTWRWWWLAVVVPALLVAGLLVSATLWARRRRVAARRGISRETARDVEPPRPASVPTTDDQWAIEPGRDLGLSPFAPGYPQMPGHPQPVAAPDQPAPSTDRMPSARYAAPRAAGTEPAGGAPARFEDEIGVDDPDAVDTAPTRIPSEAQVRTTGRHAAVETDDADARTAAKPTIHLPLEDPREAPEGYPVKGNASFGLYYTPDSKLYDDAFAELWFASEEVARANGFIKAR